MDGDQHTGFYRPVDERAPEPVVTEAYSWGSLTSASRSLNQDGTTVGVRKDLVRPVDAAAAVRVRQRRLLDPPPTAGPGGAEQWGERGERPLDLGGSAAWFQRVLCLGVTATFALAAVGAGVDLVGWQCETRECLSKLPFLGFLEVRPAGEGGGRWGPACWLSGSWPRSPPCWSCGGQELVPVRGRGADQGAARRRGPDRPSGRSTSTRSATRWRAAGSGRVRQVRRLAALHLAFGILVACAAAWLATFLIDQGRAGLGGRVTGAPSWYWGAGTGVLLGVALLVLLWPIGHEDVTQRDGTEGLGRVVWVLPLAAAACSPPSPTSCCPAGLATEATATSWLRGDHHRPVHRPVRRGGAAGRAQPQRAGRRPAAPCRGRRRRRHRAPDAAHPRPRPDVRDRTRRGHGRRGDSAGPAGQGPGRAAARRPTAVAARLGARGPAIIFGMGWLLAVIYSVGALYRLADWLNGRQARRRRPSRPSRSRCRPHSPGERWA